MAKHMDKPPREWTVSERLSHTKFIVEAGLKLRFSEEAIATAAVFYHTFCSAMNVREHDHTLVVMATLSLASKVQETHRKLSDVVNTCHRCLHQDSPALEVGNLYWQLKDSVARYELLLLRALKFQLYVKLPHPYMLHFLLALSRWVDQEAWQRSHVTRVAWALLQDSFHSPLCLRHPPHVLATAVLYLALHCCKLTVPNSSSTAGPPQGAIGGPLSSQEELSADTERGSASSSFSGEKAKRRTVSGDSESGEGRRRREEEEREWWEVFSPGTSEQVLQDIASQVMAVYDCEAGEGGEGGRGSGDRTRDSKEASGTASPKAKSDSSEKIPETMS